MYTIKTTGQFKKDVKRCQKRGYDMSLLRNALSILAETGTLPDSYYPHKLTGDYKGHWECHLQLDWLLVWKKYGKTLTLTMTDTGTHSDLYGK